MDTLSEAKKFVQKHYIKNRSTVTEATNKANEEVAKILGGKTIDIPSETECFTWIIPKQWEVKEAYIKDITNGKEIVNFKNNPLHLWSASEHFQGTLTYNQLKEHLLYRKDVPNGIPYHYAIQYNYSLSGWGFSLTYNQYKKLDKKAKYKVVVDTKLKKGVLKIADCIIPGKTKDTIFIAAHTCHPSQVNDGLINVALAVDLLSLFIPPEPFLA